MNSSELSVRITPGLGSGVKQFLKMSHRFLCSFFLRLHWILQEKQKERHVGRSLAREAGEASERADCSCGSVRLPGVRGGGDGGGASDRTSGRFVSFAWEEGREGEQEEGPASGIFRLKKIRSFSLSLSLCVCFLNF